MARRKPAKKPARGRKPGPKAPAKRVARAGAAGKAEGDAPVKAYIESLRGWKKEIARRFDELIQREVPDVRRAVKWSVPFYGLEGQGWFASFGAFSKHVKLNFFRGAELKPPPPKGESQLMRSLDLAESDPFDEKQVASWIRQASKLPGWGAG